MSSRFDGLRAQIAANDRRLVELVNERLRLVEELWQLKAELGVDRIDSDRERALRNELAAANAGPLSPQGLDRLVALLLDLTKRELSD